MLPTWMLVVFQIVCSFSMFACQTTDCSGYTVCRECISSPSCLWCSDPDLEGSHCMSREYSSNCSTNKTQDPHSTINNIQTGQGQISPVTIKMNLRVGEPQTFVLGVAPSPDYPLDLYFLMDLSNSMSDDLTTLKSLTTDLANTLGNITSDFRIGFGAFNEKPILPFTLVETNDPRFVVTDYSFRHIVSLTRNITRFKDAIAPLVTVANHDQPEAMLEGLLQAIVCKDTIGWRNESRKLILVITDERFHSAGDGILLGLTRRNDGRCHVPVQNSSGLPVDYQMYNVFDYPSVGQVQAALQEHDIIPIFSSIPFYSDLYESLASQIEGAVFQAFDRSNADRFLEIIENSYNTTTQRVELVPLTDSDIEFGITTTCNGILQPNNISVCDHVQIGQIVDFSVQVTLRECTPNLPRNVSLRIPGFGIVAVEVSGICSCSCEDETVFNETESCSGNGHLSCGVCECLQGWYDEECRCPSEEAVNRPCLFGSSPNTFCSNHGECVCGECRCIEPPAHLIPTNLSNAAYFGDACECDNFTCAQNFQGLVCSDRGKCGCNQHCECEVSPTSGQAYTGIACECPPVEEACLNPLDDLICSGNGVCNCDRCRCESGFIGTYCNTTVEDEMIVCNGQSCVECAKNLPTSKEVNCDSLNCSITMIDQVEEMDYEINGLLTLECSFVDQNDCRHVYYTIGRREAIHAENMESCPITSTLPVPVWGIAVIVIGGLLVIGVLILIVAKLICMLLDRYEFHQWEKSKRDFASVKQNSNPLYLSCETSYTNVAYYSPSEEEKRSTMSPERRSTKGKKSLRKQAPKSDISSVSS